jgi:hypothetical protein
MAVLLLNLIGLAAAVALIVSSRAAEQGGYLPYLLVALLPLNVAADAYLMVRRNTETQVVDRRRQVRLLVEVDAALGASPCRVQDLSLGGARVLIDDHSAPSVGEAAVLAIEVSGERFELRCSVRRRLEHGYHTRVALEFLPDQDEAITNLAMAMLRENPSAGDDITITRAA